MGQRQMNSAKEKAKCFKSDGQPYLTAPREGPMLFGNGPRQIALSLEYILGHGDGAGGRLGKE
jgi:hypothetical protein